MIGLELVGKKNKNEVALLTVHFHFLVCLGEERIVVRVARSVATKYPCNFLCRDIAEDNFYLFFFFISPFSAPLTIFLDMVTIHFSGMTNTFMK